MSDVWVHLHLPRYKRYMKGGSPCVNSVKRGRAKMDYVHAIYLDDATFVVHERGRQKALETGHRNVHAWVVGKEGTALTGKPAASWRKAVYSPFKGGTFVDTETLTPVYQSDKVYIIGKDVFYKEA